MAPPILSDTERAMILSTAREAIEARLAGRRPAPPADPPEATLAPSGAFVTLHARGRLRGCIGVFRGDGPLWKTIQEMAVSAAFHDPRFSPLTAAELPDVDLEVSVLSPLTRAPSIDAIEVGTHGIYITKGSRRGVLLPQVATEWGWDRDEFLRQTCYKAGLPHDAWADPDTIVEIFTAEVFGEPRD